MPSSANHDHIPNKKAREELVLKLFEKIGRRMELTQAGKDIMPYISQPYIKNDITAVHWRSITSGEMVRHIIGSSYR